MIVINITLQFFLTKNRVIPAKLFRLDERLEFSIVFIIRLRAKQQVKQRISRPLFVANVAEVVLHVVRHIPWKERAEIPSTPFLLGG